MEEKNEITQEELNSFYEETIKGVSRGDVVKGKVVAVTDKEAMVDIGYKAEGTVPLAEFEEPPQVGDELDVYVRSLSHAGEGPLLSKKEAERIRAWENLRESLEKGTPVKGKVVRRIKGGFRVDVGGVEAFLPMSQADGKPVKRPEELVSKVYEFKVLDFNERSSNVILSRRQLLEEEEAREKEAFWERMKAGKVFEGKVKSLTTYGAFVDLGVVDGLLHINDISWRKIKHPSDGVDKGQRVWVKVLDFDREKEKVSLGMKQLTPDPWEKAEEKYPLGTKVKGKVTGVVDYGAFVEVEEGLEGLIHISEFSWSRRIKHPSEVLKEGDEVECVVTNVDRDGRRLSLSLKQVEPDPWQTVEELFPVGKMVEAVVTRVYPDRALVELAEGVEGVLRSEDLSWDKRVRHPGDLFQRRDKIEAKILWVDPERRKVRVGFKQTKPDPWDEFLKTYAEGDNVRGNVSSVTDFGVFLEIMSGVEGLIHVSQLDEKKVKDPREIVKEGDTISAKIVKIDPAARRISLSVREFKRAQEVEETGRFMDTQSQGEGFLKLGEILGKMINKENK
jgi:small subunit ribosomal protein S1